MTRFSVAKQRAELFGGHPTEHRNDAGRGCTLGIDECSRPQQLLRTSLALALFGDGLASSGAAVHRLLLYSFRVVPRFDSLDLIAGAPDNVTETIAAGADPLPGFRYAGIRDGRAQVLHIPTGGVLTVGPIPAYSRHYEGYVREHALTHRERMATARWELVSEDARVLLAGLVARLSIDLGDGGYGHLLDYQLPDRSRSSLEELELTGAHNEWMLTVTGSLAVDRLARVMAAAPHGIAGCVARQYSDNHVMFRLGRCEFHVFVPGPSLRCVPPKLVSTQAR
ncbi:hypothetical protein [Nocardia wallacei]|uniref:hypothetical protein n=1 Tax=Nocardia wallacei TaxID=480035 RepID=UPI0024562D02|nr:hypothetical protein [Nocardia wallacei]